jgi:hypothetical protein
MRSGELREDRRQRLLDLAATGKFDWHWQAQSRLALMLNTGATSTSTSTSTSAIRKKESRKKIGVVDNAGIWSSSGDSREEDEEAEEEEEEDVGEEEEEEEEDYEDEQFDNSSDIDVEDSGNIGDDSNNSKSNSNRSTSQSRGSHPQRTGCAGAGAIACGAPRRLQHESSLSLTTCATEGDFDGDVNGDGDVDGDVDGEEMYCESPDSSNREPLPHMMTKMRVTVSNSNRSDGSGSPGRDGSKTSSRNINSNTNSIGNCNRRMRRNSSDVEVTHSGSRVSSNSDFNKTTGKRKEQSWHTIKPGQDNVDTQVPYYVDVNMNTDGRMMRNEVSTGTATDCVYSQERTNTSAGAGAGAAGATSPSACTGAGTGISRDSALRQLLHLCRNKKSKRSDSSHIHIDEIAHEHEHAHEHAYRQTHGHSHSHRRERDGDHRFVGGDGEGASADELPDTTIRKGPIYTSAKTSSSDNSSPKLIGKSRSVAARARSNNVGNGKTISRVSAVSGSTRPKDASASASGARTRKSVKRVTAHTLASASASAMPPSDSLDSDRFAALLLAANASSSSHSYMSN